MNAKLKIFIINDNHFINSPSGYQFEGSKFHLFLKGFSKANAFLSSPIYDNQINSKPLIIDGIQVLPRIGYGRVINFYKKIPITVIEHYKVLKKHIAQADAILLVAPACTLPISYLICRLLKKPLALYIVGDVVEVIKQDESSHFVVRLFKLMAAKWEWFITQYISKKHTTFTLGCSTYNKLSIKAYDLRPAMTSLVSENVIIYPQKKPLKNPLKLLTVSRLSSEKGIGIALEAVAQVINDRPSLSYTIIGDGPEMMRLKKKACLLGIESHIIFLGYLEQLKIRQYYLSADIFILPSLSEGIPKVILDAMASATPIISTLVGGIPDLLSDNRGWLIKPNNVEELVEALQDCIDNDEKRYTKLLNANTYIHQHTTEQEAGKIESILLKFVR